MNRNIDFTVGPYQLALDITNKCNLRCLHCYNASGENRVMEHELSDDEVIKFVKDILPMKLLNFCFCGGETLLRKELICKCIKMLSNCGVRTAIVTNGILASESVIRDLYHSGLNSIQFSVDGAKAESHDKLRNKTGVYDSVFRAIDIVRKYDMEMSIAFTPTSFNIEELEELHTKLESMSFNNKIELRVQPLMPLGRGNDHLIRFPEHTELPMYYISIRANGDIVTSPYLPLVVGNIRNHSIEEYWNGGLYELWKKKIPCYMAAFIKSVGDMGRITEKFPATFMDDIYIDMLEKDLDDLSLLPNN